MRTRAFDGDDVLGAGGFGLGVGFGGGFLVEDDLGDAGAVAEVEEDEVAVVAAAVDPAHEDYVLAGCSCAEFATHVRALQDCLKSLVSQSFYCTEFDACSAALGGTRLPRCSSQSFSGRNSVSLFSSDHTIYPPASCCATLNSSLSASDIPQPFSFSDVEPVRSVPQCILTSVKPACAEVVL